MKKQATMVTCCLFLTLTVAAQAQQTFVKGAEHPEQIPDEAAAAAVFSMHSGAQDADKHQLKVGLSESDQVIYAAALETYHRARMAKAPGVNAHSLLENLHAQLSAAGYEKLMTFIRSEKTFMQYAQGNGGEVQ